MLLGFVFFTVEKSDILLIIFSKFILNNIRNDVCNLYYEKIWSWFDDVQTILACTN